jgi:uncharacterized membrane protein
MHMGHLHVAVVHLPIGLALAAGAADLLWLLTRRTFFRNAGLYCLAAAILVAPAALLTGEWLSEDPEMFTPTTAQAFLDRVEDHSTMAYVSFGLMAAAAAVRWIWSKKSVGWLAAVYGLLMAAMVICIGITGDLGGKLVYGTDWFSKLFSP